MMSARRIPPSRERYEKKNPTVSFRVSLTQRQRLKAICAKSGQPLSIVLKEALGLVETKVDEAYRKGYRLGLGRFELPCAGCGKTTTIDTKNHESARETLKKAFSTWKHVECVRSAGITPTITT